MAARRPAARITRIRCRAFAKINLDLRVLGVRPDGYHELRTTFQSIALADTLTFTRAPGPFRIDCDDPDCPTDRRNLVWRAAEQVWKAARRRGAPRDLHVKIVKRIPMQAGLGGGSSDAAAALRALAALWRVALTRDRLHRMAAALGADVPYFLEGGTVLGLERGDRLFPLEDIPRAWVVLVVPGFGVSTKKAFSWWDRRWAGRAGTAGEGQRQDRLPHQTIFRRPWPNVIPSSRGWRRRCSGKGRFTRRFRAAGRLFLACSSAAPTPSGPPERLPAVRGGCFSRRR